MGWAENVGNFIDSIIRNKGIAPKFQDDLISQATLDAAAITAERAPGEDTIIWLPTKGVT